MKRLLLLFAKAIMVAPALLLLVALAANALFEAYGIPDWAANRICAALADQGVSIRAENMLVGLTHGLVLEEAQIRLKWRGMPVTLSCEELRLRPVLRDLLSGHLRVGEAALQNAQAALYFGAGSVGAGDRRSLRLEHCSGMVRRRMNGAVDVTLEGVADRVSFRLGGRFRNPEALRLGPRPAAQPDDLEAKLTRLADVIDRCRFSERDLFIGGQLDLDLAQPATLTFDGEAVFSNLFCGDLLVSHYRSDLHYRAGQVRIERLDTVLGTGQALTGCLTLDLDAGRVSGRIAGHVLPETLWAILPSAKPDWMDRVTVLTPLAVTAELAPSPLLPSLWHIKAEVEAEQVSLPGVTLAKLTAAGAWDGDVLTVEHWRADLDAAGVEFAEGKLRVYGSDRTLEAQLTASCNLADRVRQTHLEALRQALSDIELVGPLLITADLERSPLDWRRLRLYGNLASSGAQVHGLNLGPIQARFRLCDALFALEPLSAGLPDGPDDTLVLAGSVDVAAAMASGTWKLAGSLSAKATLADPLRSGPAADSPAPLLWENALALRGTVLLTPRTGALEVTAEGSSYPDRLYAALGPRLGLPDNPTVQGIRCAPGSPVAGTLQVTRADSRQPLRLLAAVHAAEFRYADLTFSTIESQIELSRNLLAFSSLRATTRADDQLSLDLRIDFDPLAVTLRNGHVAGRPDVLSSFIDNRAAKAVYHAVWNDFRWASGCPATIDLRQMAYRRVPGTQDWTLTLDGDLQASSATYRGLPIARLSANVLLDLPASVTVRNAQVQTDTATMAGQCTISLAGTPRCTFELRQVEGGFDPFQILGLINPAWVPGADGPTFSPQSAVDCRGSFYLGSQPMLQLDGTVRTPYFEYHGIRLNTPVVAWDLRQSSVHWNLLSGGLLGGTLAMGGLYDVNTRKGTLALRLDGVDLGQLAPACGLPGNGGTMPGAVSADAHVEFLRGWGGRELRIYGNGHVSLTQADLWRAPLFDPLGRMLDLSFVSRFTGKEASRLGRITRVDADLEFSGDRVVIPVFTTDGTAVSLKGRGEYCWETDGLQGLVSGQILDEAGFLRLLFQPLSWVFFNAELTGTPKNNKWRLSTAFSKLRSRTDSGRKDETVPEPPAVPPVPDP